VNVIVARHEILRTTIDVIDGEPVATVHQTWQIQIKKIDLAHSPAQCVKQKWSACWSTSPASLRFQDGTGIRVTLLGLGPHEHVLILMMHHIVCDWSSEGVMWRELSYSIVLSRIMNRPPSLPCRSSLATTPTGR